MESVGGANRRREAPNPSDSSQNGWVEVPIRNGPYEDEISLRDLYLILKRSLPLILVASLLASVAAAVWSFVQTPTFEASSVVSIGAAPVRASNTTTGDLTFEVDRPLDPDSYTRIALSDTVLRQVADSIPEGVLDADRPASALRSLFEVTNVGSDARLLMDHTASHPEPEVAALLVDAWTKASLDNVRSSLLNTFDGVAETTKQELAQRQSELEAAEARLQEFRETNALALLRRREEQLTASITSNQARLVDIHRELAIQAARAAILEEQLEQVTRDVITTDPNSNALFSGQTFTEARAAIEIQLQSATTALNTATNNLEAFDATNDLPTLNAQISTTRTTIVEHEQRLQDINIQLDRAHARRESLEESLASQTRTIRLEDVLTPGDRAFLDSDSMASLGPTPIDREVLNPIFDGLTRDLADTIATIASNTAERLAIQSALTTLRATLQTSREQYFRLNEDRIELVRILDQAKAQRNELDTRIQAFNLALLNPDNEQRVLTQANNEVVDLRTELRAAQASTSSLETERNTLAIQTTELTDELFGVQEQLAETYRAQDEVERLYEQAVQAFQRISGLEPTITYLANLTTTGSRIITSANIPTSPTRTLSPSLAALLGAIVGGMAATLFAFLREAVKPDDGILSAAPSASAGT